jgi:hypothetical protein
VHLPRDFDQAHDEGTPFAVIVLPVHGNAAIGEKPAVHHGRERE